MFIGVFYIEKRTLFYLFNHKNTFIKENTLLKYFFNHSLISFVLIYVLYTSSLDMIQILYESPLPIIVLLRTP